MLESQFCSVPAISLIFRGSAKAYLCALVAYQGAAVAYLGAAAAYLVYNEIKFKLGLSLANKIFLGEVIL